jgi:hypothetical protein
MKVIRNFLKLELSNPVVKTFVDEHQLCMQSYQDGYTFLDSIRAEKPVTNEDGLALISKFIKGLQKHHSELRENYNNFIISYYEFLMVSKTDALVLMEFNKLPADISPLKEIFEKLIDGLESSIIKTQKEMEALG